jgi:hypothetical protein
MAEVAVLPSTDTVMVAVSGLQRSHPASVGTVCYGFRRCYSRRLIFHEAHGLHHLGQLLRVADRQVADDGRQCG